VSCFCFHLLKIKLIFCHAIFEDNLLSSLLTSEFRCCSVDCSGFVVALAIAPASEMTHAGQIEKQINQLTIVALPNIQLILDDYTNNSDCAENTNQQRQDRIYDRDGLMHDHP
jgi:hypothetical protein